MVEIKVMKTTILALSAAATLLGTVAMAQPAPSQADADYQAKQAQYQDQKAQYEDSQARYHDEKRAYHRQMARWAAGQAWPERYWGDHYVVSDWSGAHLRDPGEGYRWYRDDNGNYVRVAVGAHVIEEVYVPR
jgi:Ni/Co efflux regulator RcnB